MFYIQTMFKYYSGKITYYTAPPENTDSSNTDIQIESKIITTFDKEFDINEITEDECKMIEGMFCYNFYGF